MSIIFKLSNVNQQCIIGKVKYMIHVDNDYLQRIVTKGKNNGS